MNECLSLCAMKWFNITRWKKEGVKIHLQPSAFRTYMKALFSIFAQHGILYRYESDFNRNGEFHAILKSTWREGKCLLLYCIYFNCCLIYTVLFYFID